MLYIDSLLTLILDTEWGAQGIIFRCASGTLAKFRFAQEMNFNNANTTQIARPKYCQHHRTPRIITMTVPHL